MAVGKPKFNDDLLQTNPTEIDEQRPSTTESNKEMKSLVESSISSSILDDDIILTKYRINKSSDTSRYDFGSKKFSEKISTRYLHEHTDLGIKMAIMTCPNCLLAIKSNVRYNETSLTHVAAVCLFPLGLCALPYCTTYFKNAEHYCPMCKVYLGTSFAKGGKALKCCGTKSSGN